METIPVARLDFTAVLPRILSLYVMSFLTPRDLCSAAQVSWHWRFLAEQVSSRGELLHSYSCAVDKFLSARTACGLAAASEEAGSYPTCQDRENMEHGRPTTSAASQPWTISLRGRLPKGTGRSTNNAHGQRKRTKRGGRRGGSGRGSDRTYRKRKVSEKQCTDKQQPPSVLMSVVFTGLCLRTRRAWGSNMMTPQVAIDGCTQRGRPSSGVTFSSRSSLSSPPRTIGSSISLDRAQPIRAGPSPEKVPASSPSGYIALL